MNPGEKIAIFGPTGAGKTRLGATVEEVREAAKTAQVDHFIRTLPEGYGMVLNEDSDLILVMKDGDIVEQGKHFELLEKKGFYAEHYNSQFEKVS